MHNTLVHAQHSCACTGGARDQGRDPKKSSRGSGRGRLLFCWVLALVPGPSSACTRVLSMHKNVVHAQESRACTRILPSVTSVPAFSWYVLVSVFQFIYWYYVRLSCACTGFLCMHNTLVHAQHSCACTGEARDQGRDPKKAAAPGQTRGCFLLGPSSACTRVLCMHKSVVHAQESCACTRILISKPLC